MLSGRKYKFPNTPKERDGGRQGRWLRVKAENSLREEVCTMRGTGVKTEES
jgi:hypothetical protein